MTAPQLFDIRSGLWQMAWEKAQPLEQFLAKATPAQADRWNGYKDRIAFTAEQRTIVSGFKREMKILVLAGAWCGDCARQCPMIDAIGAGAPAMSVRFIDNQAIPELRDELRIHGAARVPVAVTISEDLFEVGRSGDRTLSFYRRKAATELGDACDAGIVPPSPQELQEELGEWIAHFERHATLLRVSPFLRARHND